MNFPRRQSPSSRTIRFTGIVTLLLSLAMLTPAVQARSLMDVPEGPAAPHATTIEINQAISQANGRYVAGKDTAILVYLDNPVTVNPATQTAVVKRGDTVVTNPPLTPQPSDQPTNVLVFLCPTRAICGDWAAGTYSFDVTIDGNLTNLPNVQFVDRRSLRILAVPVKASYGGTVKSVAVEDWKVAGDFIAKVYPVAPANFNWQLGQELDASAQDVLTDAGQLGLWTALAALQPMECAANRNGPTCYDKIIGFLPERPGNLNGYTYGDPANIVAIQSGMRRTVAHEVGHNFGLGDEYDGLGGAFRCDTNPTPPNYVGKDWFNRENTNFSCTASTTQGFDDSGTGVRVIAAQAHPYEIGGRGLINTDLGNFMGNYGDVSKAWVSPDAWKQVFDQTAPVPTVGPGARPQVAPYRVVAATGFISKTGQVTVEPWYSFTTTDVLEPVSSTYTIVAVDSSGTTLGSQGLDIQFDVLDQPPVGIAPFDTAVPFPNGTTAFRILKGTTVLKEIHVPAHSPSVQVTAPSAGQTISGTATITWQASHPDGLPLYFTVEYNATGQPDDWITLAADITTHQWTDDFSTLPGGTQARIQVTASDGINAADSTSGLFTVPPQKPEVFIDEGQPGSIYRLGEEVALSGSAFDPQDGQLDGDSQLSWTSDKDGNLGTGELLVLDNLSVGLHTITLTATNSLGLQASKSVKVLVTYPEQRFFPLTVRTR